jgi:hypothetical protein
MHKHSEFEMARTKQVNITDYQPDLEAGMTRRIADCLSWFSEQAPKRPISYPELLKAVKKEKRKVTEDSPEIRRFKGLFVRANEILREEYGKEIMLIHGFGVRASTSDEDLAGGKLGRRASRAAKAVRQFRITADLIDHRKISNKALRAWTANMKHEANQLSTVEDRLLLTAPATTEENS